jgi:hypothetical protein
MEMKAMCQQPLLAGQQPLTVDNPEVIAVAPTQPKQGFLICSFVVLIFLGMQLCLPAMLCAIPGLFLAARVSMG